MGTKLSEIGKTGYLRAHRALGVDCAWSSGVVSFCIMKFKPWRAANWDN